MPQRKNLAWAELKVGALTLVSAILFAIGIFLISGQIGFFTKMITIRTLSPDAGGLKSGAPVRLTGIDVGTVKSVRISGLADISQAVEIVMEVSREYESAIRTDSEAFVVAEGLLGERYINISKGTSKGTPVPQGAIVPFHATAEFSQLVGGSRDLLDNLNVLTSRLNVVVGKMEAGEGTVGKLITDASLYNRIDSTVNEAQKFVSEITSGKGTIGQLLASDELYRHLDSTVVKLNEVADKLQNGDGTMARLIRDPSLYQKADRLVERGTVLVENVNQGRGTLGKLAQDDELFRRLNTATGNLNTLLTELQSSQGTFGRLIHDPALYNNLNSTSLEVRELLADFRQNPTNSSPSTSASSDAPPGRRASAIRTRRRAGRARGCAAVPFPRPARE